MKKKCKKNKKLGLFVLTIVVGILVMFYPVIAKFVNKKNQTDAISKYIEQIQESSDDDIELQKKQYENYNKNINDDKISTVDVLKRGQVLGYIRINKINVFLPIYEGSDDKTLLKGIGHLENTSMPTKKYEYHAVFVGHTGITTKKIFDDLPNLSIGDEFSITILNDEFTYKVCSIKKVLPSQTKDLKVQSNKQLVTLVTCIPKYVNSHRLLVTGEVIGF